MDVAETRARVPSFYALDVMRAMTGRVPDYRALAAEAHQLARDHGLPGLIGRTLTFPVAIAGMSGWATTLNRINQEVVRVLTRPEIKERFFNTDATNLKKLLVESMKAKDAKRLATVRLMLAALKDRDIAARSDGHRELLGDDEILTLLAKMIKQREESAAAYDAGTGGGVVSCSGMAPQLMARNGSSARLLC